MKAKYIIEDLQKKLKGELTKNEKIYFNGFTLLPTSLNLTLGKTYTILGIEYLGPKMINYMLVDDTQVSFPKFYPAEFFDIIDNRMSKYWINAQKIQWLEGVCEYPVLISFEEAVNRTDFFDKLVEGDRKTINIFEYSKAKIENEFPNELLQFADLITDNWLMCPMCTCVWDSTSIDGIVECPNHHSLNNPLWELNNRQSGFRFNF